MPTPASGPPPEASGSGPLRRPLFHGTGGTLFGIHVVNTLLTLVTLGFYYFWAKTRLRRYLFSHTEIEGDRFAYHGTGRACRADQGGCRLGCRSSDQLIAMAGRAVLVKFGAGPARATALVLLPVRWGGAATR